MFQRVRSLWLSLASLMIFHESYAGMIDTATRTSLSTGNDLDCTPNITLVNGGFNTGTLSPWYLVHQPVIKAPPHSFASPGYKGSSYALQLSYPHGVPVGGNPSWFSLWQNTTGACVQHNYTTSFAVNWNNYSSLGNPGPQGCTLSVDPGCHITPGTDLPVFYANNASSSSGWHVHSFNCTLGVKRKGYVKLSVFCGVDDDYLPIPPFTMFIDSIGVTPA